MLKKKIHITYFYGTFPIIAYDTKLTPNQTSGIFQKRKNKLRCSSLLCASSTSLVWQVGGAKQQQTETCAIFKSQKQSKTL